MKMMYICIMETRICNKCKIRPVRNSYSYACKECHCQYQKEWYKKHPKSINNSVKKQTKAIREYIIKSKSKPCLDCNKEYPYYVMDYDHVRGVKEFNLSVAASKYRSLDKIKKEILKCDLVCANCHRERTFSRILSRGVIGSTVDFDSADLGSNPDEITI